MKPSPEMEEMLRAEQAKAEAEIRQQENCERKQRKAKSNGGGPQTALPPPSLPMAVARAFVAQNFTEDGELSLLYWRDGWWEWQRSHWQELEYRAIRSG